MRESDESRRRRRLFLLPQIPIAVIAGLDPAIHPLRKTLAKLMDTRVKPAYDGCGMWPHFRDHDIPSQLRNPRPPLARPALLGRL